MIGNFELPFAVGLTLAILFICLQANEFVTTKEYSCFVGFTSQSESNLKTRRNDPTMAMILPRCITSCQTSTNCSAIVFVKPEEKPKSGRHDRDGACHRIPVGATLSDMAAICRTAMTDAGAGTVCHRTDAGNGGAFYRGLIQLLEQAQSESSTRNDQSVRDSTRAPSETGTSPTGRSTQDHNEATQDSTTIESNPVTVHMVAPPRVRVVIPTANKSPPTGTSSHSSSPAVTESHLTSANTSISTTSNPSDLPTLSHGLFEMNFSTLTSDDITSPSPDSHSPSTLTSDDPRTQIYNTNLSQTDTVAPNTQDAVGSNQSIGRSGTASHGHIILIKKPDSSITLSATTTTNISSESGNALTSSTSGPENSFTSFNMEATPYIRSLSQNSIDSNQYPSTNSMTSDQHSTTATSIVEDTLTSSPPTPTQPFPTGQPAHLLTSNTYASLLTFKPATEEQHLTSMAPTSDQHSFSPSAQYSTSNSPYFTVSSPAHSDSTGVTSLSNAPPSSEKPSSSTASETTKPTIVSQSWLTYPSSTTASRPSTNSSPSQLTTLAYASSSTQNIMPATTPIGVPATTPKGVPATTPKGVPPTTPIGGPTTTPKGVPTTTLKGVPTTTPKTVPTVTQKLNLTSTTTSSTQHPNISTNILVSSNEPTPTGATNHAESSSTSSPTSAATESHYYVFYFPKDWNSAYVGCSLIKLQLVVITSSIKQGEVTAQLASKSGNCQDFWINMSRSKGSLKWMVQYEENVGEYNNWYTNYNKTDKYDDAVYIEAKDSNGKWRMAAQTQKKCYICEKGAA